ncbi:sensor domain-containing protein [Pseudooctadecabacter jejudonensis]|uniref:Cyclic di-GMP phosphodiesterase Gmr n=1 Tax=Pseudooctadecabacter jejudonensis TaxID=1391910 RepID=A0A1Y5RHB7_9RHOB|nr:bifunctional diguanylate cyclase/phosphodiesterase [Pseudooctadecabacter jejudonensis]SLN17153.1 Cyclic di-GMP phosphodiesterase Gmr [Pseudooctadecabacter jejudonensis]
MVQRKCDQRASQLVSVIVHPAAVVDADGRILAANLDFKGLTGLHKMQCVGADFCAVLSRVAKIDGTEALRQVLAGEGFEPVSVEMGPGPFILNLDVMEDDDLGAHVLCQIIPDLATDSTRLRFLLEHLNQGVWSFNVPSDKLRVTDAWRRMRKIQPDISAYIDPKSAPWLHGRVHPQDRAAVEKMAADLVSGASETFELEYRYQTMEGDWIWILSRAKVMSWDDTGAPLELVGLDTDITLLKDRQVAQEELANKFQLALDVAGIGIWEFDSATARVNWDDTMLSIYGLEGQENDQSDNLWETYLHPDDREKNTQEADKSLEEGRDYLGEYRIVRRDGDIRYIRSMARFLADGEGAGKLVGVNLDVTEDHKRTQELEAARQRLEHDSRHDALTGLANRRLLDETVEDLLTRLGDEDSFAAMHIDLDHFKQINDTMGHAVGDQLLVRVAETLRTLVGDDGLVCRNGGDEFVVLLEKVTDEADIARLCQRMIDQMKEPLILQGHRCHVGISIGVALAKGDSTDPSEVFINADLALYAAKSAGRSCYKVFQPDVQTTSHSDVSMYVDLVRALEDCEIECYYQPQFDTRTLEIIGAEALVRWNCPQNGLILPGDFLPIVKTSGLASRFDEYVMNVVLKDQTRWANAGLEIPTVALNISFDHLMQPGFVDQVQSKLQPHHAISFELLETAFLDDITEDIAAVLAQMRAAGIPFDLDDFGSGHSSVVALQAIKPHRVKVDRQLVAPLETNPAQFHILEALTCVASLQGCGVLIEGIETQTQLQAAVDLGCEAVQGFLLGRPVPADEFAASLPASALRAGA